MSPINFSFIIPHKNCPDLLRRCLDSIPKRKDIQIIIIDDNSDKSKVDFSKFPGQGEDSVEVYFIKDGKGAGHARNVGLSYVKGKYVIFADCDDFFNYCIENILQEYSSKEFDIAYFNANSLDTDNYLPSKRANHLNKFIKLYIEGIDKEAIKLRYKFGEPWCKIISYDLIRNNNIKFDVTNIHNDTTFSYLVGHFAKEVLVDVRALYCVTTREGSVSTITSDDRIITRVQVFGKSELFFKKNNVDEKVYVHYFQLLKLLVVGNFTLFEKSLNVLTEVGFSKSQVMNGILKVGVIAIKEYCLRFLGFRDVVSFYD